MAYMVRLLLVSVVSVVAALLAPDLAGQSTQASVAGISPQRRVAVVDQHAQQLWVLLEHGRVLPGRG